MFSNLGRNLKLVHINAQSIHSSYPDLLDSFSDQSIHGILVSESFLKPSLPSALYALPGYRLYRNDRTG